MRARDATGGMGQPFVTVAALMLGHSAQGLTFTAFTPALPDIARDFAATGNGPLVAQLTLTIAAAGLILGALLSGWIVERAGARATILGALLAFGVAGAGGMVLTDALSLLASRMVVGFAAACLVTACVSTIAGLWDGSPRARMIGISTGLGSAASLVGLLAGGVLTQQAGWPAAFVQYPLFALLGLALAVPGLPRRGTAVRSDVGAAPVRLARLWPLYLLSATLLAVMFMGSTQFTFLLREDGVTSPSAISLIVGCITGFAVLASFAFGAIERRLGMSGALCLGLAVNAAGLALIGWSPTVAAAAVGAALMGVYTGTVMPYVHHAVAAKVPPGASARAIGLLNAFNFLGAFLNPFIFGPIAGWFGLHGLFVITGGFMAVMAVGALLMPRHPSYPVAVAAPAPE